MYIIISVICCYIVVFSILYILLLKPNNSYTARRLKFYVVLLEFIIFTNICY